MKRTLPFKVQFLLCLSLFIFLSGITLQRPSGNYSFTTAVQSAPQFQTDPPSHDKEKVKLYLPLVSKPRIYRQFFPLVITPRPTAFHSHGQTFLEWPERADLQGEVYRIYRSDQSITTNTLPQATFLVEVGKDSARFYTNRYRDRDSGVWEPRYSDRLVVEPGGRPVKSGRGLLVWTLAPEDFGGANSGTGYYAITVTPRGGIETFNPNMVVGPVFEAVAEPLPVKITSPSSDVGVGGHVYVQYMDLHNWNPTFHGPNATNDFYGLNPADPNLSHALQYAYDYVVYAPTPDICGGSFPSQIPVFFHLHGWRNNTTPPEEGYRKQDRFCAYGVYPIDVSNTWYFGFARDNDYRLKNEPAVGDVIVNYTEQRILRMVYDLMRSPPGPAVDPQRIYVAGQSMGGTGSLAFAERYANLFAAAYASQPMTDFRSAWETVPDVVANVPIVWGQPELNLPISISAPAGWADHLKTYNGIGVWDWQNLTDSATASKLKSRLGDDMALLAVVHGSQDSVIPFEKAPLPGEDPNPLDAFIPWGTQGRPFYTVFKTGHRPWAGLITGNDHQWEYYRGLPPALADLGKRNIYVFKPFWNLHVIRDESVPGLSNLSGNSSIPPKRAGDIYNQTIKWSSSWDPWDGPPIDKADLWQISLCSLDLESLKCGSGKLQTVDVTPRRVQRFKLIPGQDYTWENWRVRDNSLIASGKVTADSYGLVTVTGFEVSPEGNRLLIKLP